MAPRATPVVIATTRLGLMLLVAATALVGCKPPSDAAAAGQLAVAVRFEGQPLVGTVPVIVEVTDAGAPVTGATVKLTGHMTHAGMQPVEGVVVETGEGGYRADQFAFTMAGDWVVTVDVTAPDGARGRGELLTTVAAK